MSGQTRRYREGPGYDHPWFDWPPPEAPTVWPDGARLAVMPLIHVEHLELDPDPDTFADPRFAGALGSYRPDYNNFTRRLYGLRVGVWRLFDIVKAHGLRATVALGAAAAEECPQIVERALADGHGIVAHGTVANRMISERMSEAEERAFIAESAARLEACLGRRARGWVGQDHGESSRTPGLLAETGFDHVIDWPNDERPVRRCAPSRPSSRSRPTRSGTTRNSSPSARSMPGAIRPSSPMPPSACMARAGA